MATIQFAWKEYHLSQPKVQIVEREALVATKSVSLHYKSVAKGVKFSSGGACARAFAVCTAQLELAEALAWLLHRCLGVHNTA